MKTNLTKSSGITFLLFFAFLALNATSFFYVFIQTRTTTSRLQILEKKNIYLNQLLDSLFRVGVATSDLNAPGNDIFESHNVDKEMGKMLTAHALANGSIKDLQMLLSEETLGLSGRALPELDEIQILISSIVEKTNKIFRNIEKNNLRVAAKEMALMDKVNIRLNFKIISLTKQWRSVIVEIANKSAEVTDSLAKTSTRVLFFNVLMSLILFAMGIWVYSKNKKTSNISEFYQKALDQSTIVAITDTTGRITYANDAFSKISGYAIDELIGKDHRILNSGHHPKSFFVDLWKTISKGNTWKSEVKNRRKDGSYYWVDTTVVPMTDENGIVEQYVAIRHDITIRKQAEEVSWSLLQTQKAILNGTNYAIITGDTEGLIQGFNSAAEAMLGYKAEELVGKMSPIIFHESSEVVERAKALTIELKQPVEPGFEVFVIKSRLGLINEHDWTYIRKDGSCFPVRLSVSSLKKSDGSLFGFVGIAADISEAKRVQQELIQSKEAALKATRIKSEFLANMSHEIRTPMNAIIGMADLLIETPLSTDQKRYVDIFRRAGDVLLSLINDILDDSKIEAGHLALEKIDFNFRNIIEDTFEVMAPRAYEKNIDLILDYPTGLVEFYVGDPYRIRQIISNLISNAIKFTPQGEVKVSFRKNTTSASGNRLISVMDTGVGIPQDKAEKLFKSFSQVDSSITRKFGGTGLGLSICKRLTELMGGEIWVTSLEGKGSSFNFTLNLPEAAKQDSSKIENVGQSFSGLRILVIDDRMANRLIIKEMLQPWGVEILEASSGEEALTLTHTMALEAKEINIVLVDNKMPGGMGGVEFSQKFRQHEAYVKTPIIVFTSDNWQLNQDEARQSGVTAFLYKPIKRQDLFNALSVCLNVDGRSVSVNQNIPTTGDIDDSVGLNILLVDDSEDNRTLIKAYLKKSKHRIVEAENGQVAYERIQNENFDIVFMDVQMPVMDGYQTTQKIRAWEKEENIKSHLIVALTAYALKEEQEKCLRAGCNQHLVKPIKKQTLFNVLNSIGKKAQEEAA